MNPQPLTKGCQLDDCPVQLFLGEDVRAAVELVDAFYARLIDSSKGLGYSDEYRQAIEVCRSALWKGFPALADKDTDNQRYANVKSKDGAQ